MRHTCQLTNDLALVPALGKHASISENSWYGVCVCVCSVRDKNETSQISLTSENHLSQDPSASECRASFSWICRSYAGLPASRTSGSSCILLGSKEKILILGWAWRQRHTWGCLGQTGQASIYPFPGSKDSSEETPVQVAVRTFQGLWG